jgi:hypothetical protein
MKKIVKSLKLPHGKEPCDEAISENQRLGKDRIALLRLK